MKVIRILALRRLVRQPLRAIIASISVAPGGYLAIALVIVVGSLTSSVQEHGRTLSGPAPLRVIGATSRGGLDQKYVDVVAHTDGVAAAIPMVQAVALVEDAHGKETPVLALGVDCRVEAIVGSFGCTDDALAAAAAEGSPPFVSATVADVAGAGAVLRTDVGRVALDGAPRLPGNAQFGDTQVVVMPIARAQALFSRPGLIDTIYVQPAPGTDVDGLESRLEQAV